VSSAYAAQQLQCNLANGSSLNFGAHEFSSTFNVYAQTQPLEIHCHLPSDPPGATLPPPVPGTYPKVRLCARLVDNLGNPGDAGKLQQYPDVNYYPSYNLYKNPTYSQAWGAGWQISDHNGYTFSFYLAPIYGRLQSRKGTAQGNYLAEHKLQISAKVYSSFFEDPPDCDAIGTPQVENINISLTSTKWCAFSTIPTVDFGHVNAIALSYPILHYNKLLRIGCSAETDYSISVDEGMNFENGSRHMRLDAASNKIRYELYKNGQNTIRWGDGQNYGEPIEFSGSYTNSRNIIFYARAYPDPSHRPGLYSDTLVITVTY